MTGLEFIKAPGTTAGEIADIISQPCPPIVPAECDRLSCRECWLAWLTTGEPVELTRLRQLLREVDAYVCEARADQRPPEERTARDDEELARLKELLREVDDYVTEKSRGRTSQ